MAVLSSLKSQSATGCLQTMLSALHAPVQKGEAEPVRRVQPVNVCAGLSESRRCRCHGLSKLLQAYMSQMLACALNADEDCASPARATGKLTIALAMLQVHCHIWQPS